MLLTDKIIIISGVGPGLGVHLASLAVAEGASVVIAARSTDNLDSVESAVLAEAPDASLLKVSTDITDRDQCKRLVDQTVQRFGRIDGLINSAYFAGALDSVESADMRDWRRVFDVNVFGTMNLIQETLPCMKEAANGSIVNVNSQVVHKPLAGQGGYAASKAALACITSYVALECGQYGIRANSVFLGWMWGPAVEGYFENVASETGTTVDTLREHLAESMALKRVPEDRECARSVLYLVSDAASAVSGASLDVNGGDYLPT